MEVKHTEVKEKPNIKIDFASYVTAAAYGMEETFRAYRFSGISLMTGETVDATARANQGFAKLLDQNTGDGTIMALGFLGAEVVTGSINLIAKKLGSKGVDPSIRFVASVAFGMGLATYLETTTAMSNTIDIPNDLFGVALAAALILGAKVVSDRVTTESLEKAILGTGTFFKELPQKMDGFSDRLVRKIQNGSGSNKDEVVEDISRDFLDTIDVI